MPSSSGTSFVDAAQEGEILLVPMALPALAGDIRRRRRRRRLPGAGRHDQQLVDGLLAFGGWRVVSVWLASQLHLYSFGFKCAKATPD